MDHQIILFCFFSLILSVTCDLNLNEGDPCEWEGVKGTCVDVHRCFTSLAKRSPAQPICSQKGQRKIICCTDCELVNDTRNAVITPSDGVWWKNGQDKALDRCLQYITTLPYECYSYGGISRELDGEKKCHRYGMWGIGGSPPMGGPPRSQYPYMAMLRYGEGSSDYRCTGTIISEKYILTAADCLMKGHGVKEVVVGMLKLSEQSPSQQVRRVARAVPHPAAQATYHQNNVALIEVDTPFSFNMNVLPACLHLDETYDDFANIPTWKDDQGKVEAAQMMGQLQVQQRADCSDRYNDTVHLCYGSWHNGNYQPCKTFGGEPLIGSYNHISACTATILGVTASPTTGCQTKQADRFAKVAYYVPWIESVVWP